MSKVSICLSSYNHAKFLRESIDSVLNQTFSDYELFIEDDASTDESWSIIQSYSDPRIQPFRNAKNRNDFERKRKVIFEMATGEYIATHHSDDVWEPEKLQKQVEFLDTHPEVGAVFTHVQIIGEDGKPFKDKTHFYYKIFDQPNRSRHEWLNFFFYHANALCHPSVLIRKVCYEQCGFFRHGLFQLADFDMWIRLCLKYEIYILPDRLVRFRVRDNEQNASGNRTEAQIRHQFEFLQILDNYLEINDPNEFIKIFPSSAEYFKQEQVDLGFALAMSALKSESNILKLFGLRELWKIFNDENRAKKIEGKYGFSRREYYELTGKYDIFSVIKPPELMSQLAEQDVKTRIVVCSGSGERAGCADADGAERTDEAGTFYPSDQERAGSESVVNTTSR